LYVGEGKAKDFKYFPNFIYPYFLRESNFGLFCRFQTSELCHRKHYHRRQSVNKWAELGNDFYSKYPVLTVIVMRLRGKINDF